LWPDVVKFDYVLLVVTDFTPNVESINNNNNDNDDGRDKDKKFWKVVIKVKVTLRLAVYRQSVHLGVKPLETHDQTFFQLNSCGNRPYVTSSLKRGWVCLL
jgi:hypothetical protein